MEFFRRSLNQSKLFLDSLDRNTRITIVSLLIAGTLVIAIMLQYAAGREQVAISAFTSEPSERVRAVLVASGIEVTAKDGQLMVSQEHHQRALSVLQQNELMKADTTQAWMHYLESQNIWDSRTADQNKYLLALQRVLAAQIAEYPGVKSAAVNISSKEQKGLSQGYRPRSASITVNMKPGNRLNKQAAHAFAYMVSSAVTPMDPKDVTVIDVSVGKHFVIRGEIDNLADETMERVVKKEQEVVSKVETLLGYIHGVIVVANVQVDNILKESERAYTLRDTEPLAEKRTEEEVTENFAMGGEAGVRANVGTDIAGGGGNGSRASRETTHARFHNLPLTEVSHRDYMGGQPTNINVSINIPRSFVVSLYMRGKPEDTPEPTDADLAQLETALIEKVKRQVEPVVMTRDTKGIVAASVIPDASNFFQGGQDADAASGILNLVSTGWGRSAGMIALAMLPLGIMLMMARKATQSPSLPSVEELAGIPPTLPHEDDLVGEADADEDMMAGIEVNENDLKFRKIAEQISEMIKSSPDEAGALIGRWVGTED